MDWTLIVQTITAGAVVGVLIAMTVAICILRFSQRRYIDDAVASPSDAHSNG